MTSPLTLEQLIDEARDLCRLICPFPEEIDDGSPIERMPDDCLRIATMLGDLCDRYSALLASNEALVKALRDAETAISLTIFNRPQTEQPPTNIGLAAVWGEVHAAIASTPASHLSHYTEEIKRLREALAEVLPYARACIGLPECAWPADSAILKARDALKRKD